MRRVWICAVFGGGIMPGLGTAPAVAQSGWEFEVTPYAWPSGVDGDIGTVPVSGVPLENVTLSFGDILAQRHQPRGYAEAALSWPQGKH